MMRLTDVVKNSLEGTNKSRLQTGQTFPLHEILEAGNQGSMAKEYFVSEPHQTLLPRQPTLSKEGGGGGAHNRMSDANS